MKKTIIAAMAVAVSLSSSLTAFAAPETMADGTIFDAEYYAQSNPDVTALYGTDKNALYNHYIMYGKAEGRKAYLDSDMAMTRYGVLLEAGDENYLRMGQLMCAFDYSLTPTFPTVYDMQGNVIRTSDTPFITDPAANFVRSDWSGDAGYQAIRNEIIQKVAAKGIGAEIKGEASDYTQYPLSEAEYKASEQMLKNLSIDLMKEGIVDNCYLSWGAANGYLYLKQWGYEQNIDIFANNCNATMSQYDKHPEIWGYINKPRAELYDDTAEMDDDNFSGGWDF